MRFAVFEGRRIAATPAAVGFVQFATQPWSHDAVPRRSGTGLTKDSIIAIIGGNLRQTGIALGKIVSPKNGKRYLRGMSMANFTSRILEHRTV